MISDAVWISVITVGMPAAGVIYSKLMDKSSSVVQIKQSEMEKLNTQLDEQLTKERELKEKAYVKLRAAEKQSSQCFRIIRNMGAEVRILKSHVKNFTILDENTVLRDSYREQSKRCIAKLEQLIQDAYEVEDGEGSRIGEHGEVEREKEGEN